MSNFGHNSNFVSANSLTDDQRKKLKGAIQELNDSMTRIASEREFIKESINTLHDELGIDKKVLRRMAKTYFNASFNFEKEEQQTFEEFYELVINGEDPNVLRTDGWSNK